MQLQTCFRIRHDEVVAIVGGGGKSTLMFRLAEEIVAAGRRVITTTTTRIFSAQTELAPCHMEVGNPANMLRELPVLLQAHPHVLITMAHGDISGKAPGIPAEFVEHLKKNIGDPKLTILVEADGSRMRSLKAPAAHEPVIPNCTTLLVPIVGADIFGECLSDEHVHRAQIAADLIGARIGGLVTPDMVSRILLHPQGGVKGMPLGSRLVPVINKVETQDRLQAGRDTARSLLSGDADEVLLATTSGTKPVCERWGRVAVIILAAGGSTRMSEAGEIKQLLPWRRGTLLTRAVDAATQSEADSVVVVVGCQAERVKAVLEGRELTVAHNPEWESGQSASVRAGLDVLSPRTTSAIFLLVDQPSVDKELIDSIIRKHRETAASIVAPWAGGRRANPVLFDRVLWHELCQVRGDMGGRALLDRHADKTVYLEWGDEILAEVNTRDDYVALRNRRSGAQSD